MTQNPEAADRKADLRKKLREIRSQVTPAMAEAASQSVWNILSQLPLFKKAKGIGAFASAWDEINTFPLLESSLESGKRIYLPRVARKEIHLDFYQVKTLEDLETGPMGIPEPKEGAKAHWEDLDLVLVPGIAFDHSGNRLGYGKGYYDRLLPQLRESTLTIGLAFSFQIVEQVPIEAWDLPVKALLTEKGFTQSKKA